MFNKIKLVLPLLPKLGLANVITVLLYRLAIRFGLIERLMPIGRGYKDPLFKVSSSLRENHQYPDSEAFIIKEASELLNGNIRLFSNRLYKVGSPPDWFLNPVSQKRCPDVDSYWSGLPDFSDEVGDIKIIWEASRFGWALVFARAYRVTGDEKYLSALNKWASDWTEKNPLNRGPNWKCGQEAAIRMMNLMLAAFVLGQDRTPAGGLIRFVKENCERIEPTISYAISQDNNHGTSEAAALFIGGGWLKRHAADDDNLLKKAEQWERKGRFWLEDRVDRLIESDGSFSQYSVNYHRLMVDTLSLIKFWQGYLDLKNFSGQFNGKARAAVYWLFQMVDSLSGDAPNLGANDGALLFSLTSCDYRDFRPSVQLGAVLFFHARAYKKGPWDEALYYPGLQETDDFADELTKKSQDFDKGGYVILQAENSWGAARIPNYRFRPGHADALHFDLWYKGRNVLRDGGSYSYNCAEPWQSYFPGTQSHNTIEFDGRDQMPRISRFLWGSWTKGKIIEPLSEREGFLSWSGAYTDYEGCRHQRTISVRGDCWHITDVISGFKEKAVLRWRLEPGQWTLEKDVCRGNDLCIEIDSDDAAALELRLTEGWESRRYMEKTRLPALEALIKGNHAKIRTVIRFKEKI